MIENLKVVEKKDVLPELKKMKESGYRLITVIAHVRDNRLELTYPLESWKTRAFAAIRTHYEFTDEVQSVQDIYMNAMLYEWEIVDLFDVKVENCPSGIYLEPEKKGPFRRDV
jgi:ech hydrogenase subunit D